MSRLHSTSAQLLRPDELSIPSPDDMLAAGCCPALREDVGLYEFAEPVDLWIGGPSRAGSPRAKPSGEAAVAAGRPGPISNTPLTNSKLPRRLPIAGLDWLEWSSYGTWDQERFGATSALLEDAKRDAQEDAQGGGSVDLAGRLCRVRPTGAHRGLYCPWVLDWEGIEIAFTRREDEHASAFNVHVVAGSAACMAWGPAVYARVKRLLVELGFTQARAVPSRVDLACDLCGVGVDAFAVPLRDGGVVRRARKAELFFDGQACTGFRLGGSAVMVRVYDKWLESASKFEPSKVQLLVEERWYGQVCPEGGATRVEFQHRRDVLRAMGFGTVEQLLGNLAAVARWDTEEWIRWTDGVADRTHTTSAETSQLWQSVQAAMQRAFRTGEERPIVWRRKLQGEADPLRRMAMGCMSSMAVIGGRVPRNAEEFRELLWDWFGSKVAAFIEQAEAKARRYQPNTPLDVLGLSPQVGIAGGSEWSILRAFPGLDRT